MTVIVLDCAPESIRGELTRWFLELKPGVFAGKVNVHTGTVVASYRAVKRNSRCGHAL